MLRRSVLAVLIGLPLLLPAPPVLAQEAAAQEEEVPRFMAVLQYKVPYTTMARMGEMFDMTAPVWDEVMAEGKIAGWGVLTHMWGDEWNYLFWVLAMDHASFVTAWDEATDRAAERFPDAMAEWRELFTEHRDNFYYVRTLRRP